MTGDRQLEVLRAIVQDYVRNREPVGSRNIVDRYNLGVSPATIRNDMAALEEAGLIAQPHTSAGRIPTDAGYRLFVDKLNTMRPLSAPEKRAITQLLDGASDLDGVLERTVRLLSHLTHQVAVVQYPTLRRSTLRHIELVPTSSTRLLVIVIMESGRVEQRTLELGAEIDDIALGELRARANAAAMGRQMPQLTVALEEIINAVPETDRGLATAVVRAICDLVTDEVEERIVMAGTANLVRSDVDFARTVSPVLEALEEQVVMLRLLSEMAEDAPVAVRIGAETQTEALSETAIVAGAYSSYGPDAVGKLGVVGPTRMDYSTSMAAVHAVARYLSKILAG